MGATHKPIPQSGIAAHGKIYTAEGYTYRDVLVSYTALRASKGLYKSIKRFDKSIQKLINRINANG